MKKVYLLMIVFFFSIGSYAQERKTDLGVAQLPESKMKWFEDAKFGMFIHWGPYAVPAKGEWYMYQSGIPYAQYSKYYLKSATNEYFDASSYDPKLWVKIAKDAGMRYMVLTTRHHDDFALFKTDHPGSLTAYKTIGRDLVKEYVDALRKNKMRIGLYFSVLSWRFPGYFDVTGTNATPNNWGYKTAAWHKENALEMKAELYDELKELNSNYGKLDLLWFDGAWLGLQGADRDASYFWEPGKYRSDTNQWKGNFGLLSKEKDAAGRYYGIMGMVRNLQPDMIANARSGWMGDYENEEGGSTVKGPIHKEYWEKCMNLNEVTWGYNKQQNLASYSRIVTMLVNCIVRNGNLLLNVAPDAHGVIPATHAAILKQVGDWLAKVKTSIYGTRGGPWNPKDEEYGFTYNKNKVYVHLLEGYKGTTFTTPVVGQQVKNCRDLLTKKKLMFVKNTDGTISIKNIDRTAHPSDTIIEIEINGNYISG